TPRRGSRQCRPLFSSRAPRPSELSTLSLHDALPISPLVWAPRVTPPTPSFTATIVTLAGAPLTKAGTVISIPVVSGAPASVTIRSEEHTSELQSQSNIVCRLLLEKKKKEQKPLTKFL